MLKLHAIEGTELTDYAIHLLYKQNIKTVNSFLKAQIEKLCKISNISKSEILRLRKELRNRYYPKAILLRHRKTEWTYFRTGIESLDKLLEDDELTAGLVWEISGIAGSGKTQCCHTVALNFAREGHGEVLYVDTKYDFQGKRIHQMLRARAVSKIEIGNIMQKIKIERPLTAQDILLTLENFHIELKNGNSAVMSIKLIIIDALPSAWLLLFSGDIIQRRMGKHLLTKLAHLISHLSRKYSIAFIVVNLSLLAVNTRSNGNDLQCFDENNSDEHDNDEENNKEIKPQIRPMLGHYWSTVPRIRLSIEFPEDDDEATNQTLRIIKVIKSSYTRTGDSCIVKITDAGVK